MNKLNEFIKKNKKTMITIIIFTIIIISMIIIKIIDNSEKNKNKNKIETTSIIAKQEEPKEEENLIVIHITGSVINQGIIKIPEGSRVADAIEKAGGLKEDANIENVNLAYELEDGQKIYIPNINEPLTEDYIEEGASKDIIIDNSNVKEEKVNINKADLNELQTLTGIGEATAQAIVTYREENEKFNTIEDLKNVPGIGESKFEIIKDKIKV